MRKNLFVIVAALAAFGIVAQSQAKTAPSGDSTALATVAAADQHEVSFARQALSKGVTGGVRDFANMMVTDHGKNLTDTRRVATDNKLKLAPDADVRAMEAKGRSEEQSVGKLKGDEYAKAYVDAMVKGHTEVLAKLDNQLIPGAKDAAVVAHLKATREAVAKHLAAAQALQQGNAAAK